LPHEKCFLKEYMPQFVGFDLTPKNIEIIRDYLSEKIM
jgi:hypothetical protein